MYIQYIERERKRDRERERKSKSESIFIAKCSKKRSEEFRTKFI